MKRTPPTLKSAVLECFSLIDDPRAANAAHSLQAVLFCVLVAVLCGADGFVQAEHIARLKKKFIVRYVDLRRGIPTHDTMARVFGALDPEQFVRAFASLMARLTGHRETDIINLDGKMLRGVVGVARLRRDQAGGARDYAQIVSLFSTLRCVVLGQLRSKKAVNEVSAAQELLEIVDIKGAVVTCDAHHAVYRTLEIIEERGANVVVTVKNNARGLNRATAEVFRESTPVAVVTTEEKGRGGAAEQRKYEVFRAKKTKFKTLKSFVRVTRQNAGHTGRPTTKTVTKYASSLPPEQAKGIASSIRSRWAIENGLHWVLDIEFAEDRSRIRKRYAPENFSRIRHIAFNLLSLVKTPKLSFALKRTTAALDDRYLARVLRAPRQ